MKICKNELLLLGGMYQVLAFIISWFNYEIAYATSGVLYVLFWISVLAILFNWVPHVVYITNNLFPRLSVFLAYIGWVPYFSVFYVLFSLGIDYVVTGSDSVSVFLNNYMPLFDVYMSAIVLSLLYAGYKVFYKKEDLVMDCALS